METTRPADCQIALKEWASVLIAMERGEQLVLIRKGGLIEPGSGFELQAQEFVLYPTFEHQTVNFLRGAFPRYLQVALGRRPADGQLRFEGAAKAVTAIQFHDPTIVKRLEPFHIYNDEFLQQRLKWQPEQPLVVVVVRVFRLCSPQLLPVRSSYAGCKSWVDLEQAVSLQGAVPVVEDRAFEERLGQIRAVLESLSASKH